MSNCNICVCILHLWSGGMRFPTCFMNMNMWSTKFSLFMIILFLRSIEMYWVCPNYVRFPQSQSYRMKIDINTFPHRGGTVRVNGSTQNWFFRHLIKWIYAVIFIHVFLKPVIYCFISYCMTSPSACATLIQKITRVWSSIWRIRQAKLERN